MRNISKLIVSVFLSVFSASLLSAETGGNIDNLYINEQGTILFTLSAPTSGAPTCDNSSDIWQFKVEPSNEFYREFYSTLLAARAASEVIIVGHGESCGSGYAAVIAKYLYFRK